MSFDQQKKSPFTTKKGSPFPLGATSSEQGINFSLFSDHASEVSLVLYPDGSDQPVIFPLEKTPTEIGLVWHIWVAGIDNNTNYLYQVAGKNEEKKGIFFHPDTPCIDPYAKSLASPLKWGHIPSSADLPIQAELITPPPFDWEGVKPPRLKKEDLIIYEMHVRGFTQDVSSEVQKKGSFLGLIEKIPYLQSLGINAIELMPIFEFDENSNPRCNPHSKAKLFNYWGYTSINFFCPMKRYAVSKDRGSSIQEFKTLVRELHRNGIEVILDVVYNYTLSVSGQAYPCLEGIDHASYYLLKNGHSTNYSGCGNTLNCNHNAVRKLILDSLIYWVEEMHVDGFRFDLASILTRGEQGEPLEEPPLLKEITQAPALINTKWIVEPWDAAGLYQVGVFPKWGDFSEWNGSYRDTLRRFIKGDANQAANFASAITGSSSLYGSYNTPTCSVNFITAHDGYSLNDLVSYQQKHNLENGENNQDGSNHNDSWNCGQEGPSNDQLIQQLRERQMQNLYLALFVSRGIPMIFMGDEYGHTKEGNNNTWCLDNKKNWFLWDKLKKYPHRFRFLTALIRLRKKEEVFRKNSFFTEEEIDWHGLKPHDIHWQEDRRYIACTIKAKDKDFYLAFNASHESLTFLLPSPSRSNQKWFRLIDTSAIPPENFIEDPKGRSPVKEQYETLSYSSILLQTK